MNIGDVYRTKKKNLLIVVGTDLRRATFLDAEPVRKYTVLMIRYSGNATELRECVHLEEIAESYKYVGTSIVLGHGDRTGSRGLCILPDGRCVDLWEASTRAWSHASYWRYPSFLGVRYKKNPAGRWLSFWGSPWLRLI